MSASAWDRAVVAAAKVIYGMAWDQPPEAWEAVWRADGSDEYAGFATEESERDEARTVARAALTDALPVLMEELASEVDALNFSGHPAQIRSKVLRIVRGFAAEVTQ